VETIEVLPSDILGPLTDVEERNAPKRLYLAGDRTLLEKGPRVSIVGSRQPSPEGLKRASYLARALVQHQIVVVSGLAAGIDRAAHISAIESGGSTIAVLGTPLDRSYPRENEELQALIIDKHLAVSQFPSGTPTQPKNFPLRNRTMALLTDATVIVEAGEKSGTLHQGWEALRLGRALFLMDSVARNESLSWPREMIHYGAQVLSRANLDDSLADLPAVTSRLSIPASELV
jgi:DNA processing protein